MTAEMSDQKPYLIRALWEWMVANGVRPHLMVNTRHPYVKCPEHLKKETYVAFNISDTACSGLQMTDAFVSASMRFGGKPYAVELPMAAISAIYSPDEPCRGHGMPFTTAALESDHNAAADTAAAAAPPSLDAPTPSDAVDKHRPSWLKVVK